jgi:anti-sigma factor RsiW
LNHVTSYLTAYLDCALDPDTRDAVEAHLEGCPDCREQRDRIAMALVALRQLPAPPEPSPQFETHFYARLASAQQRPRGLLSRIPWRVVAPVAAAGAAAVLLVAFDRQDRRRLELAAEHLDLFQSYEAVASVGDVDESDVALVAHLHELEERP